MLDVDGVVITGRPSDGLPWTTDIERDLGISAADIHASFFDKHWPDIVIGKKNLFDVLEQCLPVLSTSITPRTFVDYWFEHDSRIDKQILHDCDELRRSGMRIFLATNQEHQRARYLMDSLDLKHRVDGIIYSAQVGARKPDRAFFDAASNLCESTSERIFLLDDTRANVDAARSAGWAAEHWTGEARLMDLVRSR